MLNFWVRSGAPFRLQRRAYNYVNISAKFSQDHQVETPSISGDCHDSAEKKRPKLPPEVPSPDECCGTGCNDCIFLRFVRLFADFFGKLLYAFKLLVIIMCTITYEQASTIKRKVIGFIRVFKSRLFLNCRYAEDLLDYYKDGGAVALQEVCRFEE